MIIADLCYKDWSFNIDLYLPCVS